VTVSVRDAGVVAVNGVTTSQLLPAVTDAVRAVGTAGVLVISTVSMLGPDPGTLRTVIEG
jgi:hypothetical protein